MEKIEKDHYYHIFNRGINSCITFRNEDNMSYFLKLMERHLVENIDIIAYCLLNNHFHLIVKVLKDEATQAFSNLFNAYAKAFNKQQNRTGTLFERPYKRIKILDENYLKNLVLYIHKNPEKHNIVKSFTSYKFSSYQSYINSNNTPLSKEQNYILNIFGGVVNFKHAHKSDLSAFENLTGLKD
ncbi:transposase [Tamlana sp. 2201CG12-4]|uniref:transposase n=1 Tax=Tamlana sp. 2201CG12-4 TaxID=3112582 RepID=UPI002DBDE03B|nr:transposase [Tamlana sp. 2201CG12-4]MEC3906373.1 transposase [Tamlana sp. 2201CG12-4]